MASKNGKVNYQVIYGKTIFRRARAYAIKKLMAKGFEYFNKKHISKIDDGNLKALYKLQFNGDYFAEYIEIAKAQMIKNELRKIEPKKKHVVPSKSKVYFIVNDTQQICKIGTSLDPHKRLCTIQTGCPYPLRIACTINGDSIREHELHDTFKLYRIGGEWFKYKGRVLHFVEDVLAGKIS